MKALATRERQRVREKDLPSPAFTDAQHFDLHSAHPHRLALIDSRGNIVSVNDHWIRLAEQAGAALNRIGPGANYLEVCRKAGATSADSRKALRGIRGVLKQKTPSFEMDYECSTPSGPARFHMDVIPMRYQEARVAIAHQEIPALSLSNEKSIKLLQEFAQRLINAQEDERKRISQEMHDDLGNRIALLALSVRKVLKQSVDNSDPASQELSNVFDQVMDFAAAVRELSHGLHPFVLRHAGIVAALKSLQQNLERSHDVRMRLGIAPDLPHLGEHVSLCIFRVAQEALQNAVKHSGAKRVSMTLTRVRGGICLTVSDAGRGFLRSRLHKDGLGLQSMDARALSVGGRLVVNSSPSTGTEIMLTIPVRGIDD
jgi:signal transduction histidine kinase